MSLNDSILVKIHSGLVNRSLIPRLQEVLSMPEILMFKPKQYDAYRIPDIAPVTFKDQFRELYYSEMSATPVSEYYMYVNNVRCKIDIEVFFALKCMAYLSMTTVKDKANGINMVLDKIKSVLFDNAMPLISKYDIIPALTSYSNYFANEVVAVLRELVYSPVELIKYSLDNHGLQDSKHYGDLLQLTYDQFETFVSNASTQAYKDNSYGANRKEDNIVVAVRYIDDKNFDINNFL